MEKAIYNFVDKNNIQTCQLIRERTWRYGRGEDPFPPEELIPCIWRKL